MRFEDAVEAVRSSGLQMIRANAGLTAVAVGCRGGRAISQAGRDDFVVSGYVPKKLSDADLHNVNIQPVKAVAYTATRGALGSRAAQVLEIEVKESGTAFEILPALTSPARYRGLYGGAPPILNAQKPFAALRSGIGIGNPACDPYPSAFSVGTLGFYVQDDSGVQYLVSNNHVIAGENSNDTTMDLARKGNDIVQPGTLDLTSSEIAAMIDLAAVTAHLSIAQLTSWIPLQPATALSTPNNWVDAALAELDLRGAFPRTTSDIDRVCYGGSIRGVRKNAKTPPFEIDPNKGTIVGSPRVHKVGRTTGCTEGIVTDVAALASIRYRTGTVHFVDQLIISATSDNVGPFSDHGDSGSGILDDNHELVGLLFAGSARQTFANPIDRVMRALEGAVGQSLEVVTRP